MIKIYTVIVRSNSPFALCYMVLCTVTLLMMWLNQQP